MAPRSTINDSMQWCDGCGETIQQCVCLTVDQVQLELYASPEGADG